MSIQRETETEAEEKTPVVPEGFTEYQPDRGAGDVPEVQLDGGEQIEGTVVALADGDSANGPWWKLTVADGERGVITYFARGDVKSACKHGNISVGTEVFIYAEDDLQTFEDDGEKVTYFPNRIAIK